MVYIFAMKQSLRSKLVSWVVVAQTFNPSTQEADIGGSLSSRPAWSTVSSRPAKNTQKKKPYLQKSKQNNKKIHIC